MSELTPPPTPKPPSLTPVCNILIVDDEPSNLLALEAILEPLGQRLVRAASGVEALKHALGMEFAVVLLDVQMPEMDGFETAELLRKRPRTRDLPIIFLTAINKEKSFVARGYEVGAVDYLFKPYDPDTLRTKVATFVDLAKKNARIRAQHELARAGSARELADLRLASDRRYAALADAMPQIVWTADASGAFTYHNRRWAELTAANDLAELVHPDDRRAFSSGWRSAIEGGTEWEAEMRLGSSERGYRWHLVRAVPPSAAGHGGPGAPDAWVGTATDIDARVRADRALRLLADASRALSRSLDEPRELEDVLRLALPVLGDAAILDIQLAEGVTERVHVALAGIDLQRLRDPRFDLGPSTVGVSGRSEVYLDVVLAGAEHRQSEHDPMCSGRGADHLRFLKELGVSAYICVPLTTPTRAIGTVTFVRFLSGPAGGKFDAPDVALAGDLAQRIAISVENRRLHTTTEKRREELELANKSKDVFLATLSHELRTPLNAIVGWADMMKSGALAGDERARAMETIDRNAHALAGLVADLLDVSRIVTGTLNIESKLVSLPSVVDAAVQAARPACAAKELILDWTRGQSAFVVGDEGRLKQIVGNLLSNATKFTPAGGKISVALEQASRRVRVIVRDDGEGISPDFLPHVFERFRQGETERAKGLGLGLAIVKHLVEEHGGTVSVTSEGRGRGSRFVVELPVAEAAAEPIPADAVDDDRLSAETAAAYPNLEGISVLIVEDDPDGNELICTILERYGARVRSATTASQALAELSAERPRILVSDIGLPDMDGMELIRHVRATDAIRTIPAIALTAYASRQDATKAISAGFDEHITKPVQPATLGAAILRLIERDASATSAAE